MGSWSELTIGEIVFAWKYHVPTFLTFVFSPDDLFIEREEIVVDPDEEDPLDGDPGEVHIEKGGYRTTVARAKAVLDEYGYTVPFFAEIYQSFRADLNAQVRDVLDDELGGRAGPDPDEGKLKAQDRCPSVRRSEHHVRRSGGIHGVPARGHRDRPQDGAVPGGPRI